MTCLHLRMLRNVGKSVLGKKLKPLWRKNHQSMSAFTTLDNNQRVSIENLMHHLDQCMNRRLLLEGMKVHAHITVRGFTGKKPLINKVLAVYVNCNRMVDARHVFDEMQWKNTFVYNTLIKGYAENDLPEESLSLYTDMADQGVRPDKFTFTFAAKVCGVVQANDVANRIYQDFDKSNFTSDMHSCCSIITMLGKCRRLQNARQVFDQMPEKSMMSWSAIIYACIFNDASEKAIDYFNLMRDEGTTPDGSIMSAIMPVYGELGLLKEGRDVHRFAVDCGLGTSVYLCNSLIKMYCKCGSLEEAKEVFDNMPERDYISWTAIMSGYCQNGYIVEMFRMFEEMQLEEIRPDLVTMSCLLTGCAKLEDHRKGQSIHSWLLKGCQWDSVVASSLIEMYFKCKDEEAARNVFERMPYKNSRAWTSMIANYCQNCLHTLAFLMFHKMQDAGVMPEVIVLTSLLSACSRLRDSRRGKSIHGWFLKGGQMDLTMVTSLIEMYLKCGENHTATRLFERLANDNVVSWSSMISGLCSNGLYVKALNTFSDMQTRKANTEKEEIEADKYVDSVLGALSACGSIGAVKQGASIHGHAFRLGIASDESVGSALSNMYADSNDLDTSRRVFERMPCNEGVSWSSVIATCGTSKFGKDTLAVVT